MKFCYALRDDTTIEINIRLLLCRDRSIERRIGAEQVHQCFGIAPDHINIRKWGFIVLTLLVIDDNILLEIFHHI